MTATMIADTTIDTDQASAAADVATPASYTGDHGRSRSMVLVAGRGNHTAAGALAPRPRGARVQDLLRQRAHLPDGHPDRAALRARSIEAGLPLARRLATAYRGRGEPLDDLYQVAALALVKAVDGYDPTRQVAFTSYAVPTIVGALKRHFRDSTWLVRVPRRVQELAIRLAPASARLTQQLGRSPSVAELAARLDATQDDVAIAWNAWQFRRPESLDAPSATAWPKRQPFIDTIGAIDAHFDAVIDRHMLRPLVAALPARERHILAMRYIGDLSQAEIAIRVGLSQMHISRLLARVLTQLRTGMHATQTSNSTRPASDPLAARRA